MRILHKFSFDSMGVSLKYHVSVGMSVIYFFIPMRLIIVSLDLVSFYTISDVERYCVKIMVFFQMGR